MKKLILSVVVAGSLTASGQSNTALSLIEGSKNLVDLIRTFKTPRSAMAAQAFVKDSCAAKGITDFSVKNSTGKPLVITLYRRIATCYESAPLTMRVLPKNHASLYELKSGVYKIKVETEEDGVKKAFTEGEIKLNPCENPIQNIQAQ